MWMRRESEGGEARSYRTLRAVIIPGGRRFNSQKGTDPRTADISGKIDEIQIRCSVNSIAQC